MVHWESVMGVIVPRKTAAGEIRYRAQVRFTEADGSKSSRSKTFSRKALAAEWIRRVEADRELRGVGRPEALPAVAVGDLIRRYQAEVGSNFARSKNSDLKRLQNDPIAQQDAVALTVAQIVEHVRLRRESGAGPSTVNSDLVWFRCVFRYAARVWQVPVSLSVISEASEVLRATRQIGRPVRRKRRPTYDELVRLDEYWKRFQPRTKYPMREVMWLAIYSCRRQSELCRILRPDLDAKHGVYDLRDVKRPTGSKGNDKVAVLPKLGWPVVEAILAKQPDIDGRLLPLNHKMLSKYWTEACHLLGIEDLHFHDLRHEGLSRLGEDGYTVPELQQVSLHDSWGSLSIYVNMRPVRGRRLEYG